MAKRGVRRHAMAQGETDIRFAELEGFALAAPRRLCTDCGISRSSDPKACGRVCQFLKPDYETLERQVHGRTRDPERPDELFFGPFRRMVAGALTPPSPGAQWPGIVSRLGERLLETGAVDAVLAIGPHPEDRWRPNPVLITRAEDMAGVRGMRMGYAPLLALLEPARAAGHKRIALIGIPCQVHALRALEAELGFERIYVIGTPCADNTTTENFHLFLKLLSDAPDSICYLEFRSDYHVELRFDDGSVREVPFLQLPIADLPSDFFPLTCRTCVDYTNVLADITIGYMAGGGKQWLVVRNERGEELVELPGQALRTRDVTSAGNRAGPVKGFLANTERAAGGLPLRRMPKVLRGIFGWLMPRIGPRGAEFARARVEMKAIETVLHLRRSAPARMKSMIPDHVWELVKRYGLEPRPGERADEVRTPDL